MLTGSRIKIQGKSGLGRHAGSRSPARTAKREAARAALKAARKAVVAPKPATNGGAA